MENLYRALDNLSTGQRRGHVFRGSALSDRARMILERKGVIRRLDTPPLAIIDGWQERAALLKEFGIVTIGDLLFSGNLPIENLEQWKNDAFYFMAGDMPKDSGKCRKCGGKE